MLDLNASIDTYLKDFPQKTFAGKNVNITVKDLCNHTSGIRGYFENVKKGKVCSHEHEYKTEYKTYSRRTQLTFTYSKSTIEKGAKIVVLVFSLLTLNMFHSFY